MNYEIHETNKLKCHDCDHEWEYEMKGSYPCGPCPTSCPKCDAYCCPKCGGGMGRSTGDEDKDIYTSGGCERCFYSCCGGCI